MGFCQICLAILVESNLLVNISELLFLVIGAVTASIEILTIGEQILNIVIRGISKLMNWFENGNSIIEII